MCSRFHKSVICHRKRTSVFIFLIAYPIFILHAQNLDIDLLRAINVNRNVKLDRTFEFFSASATPVSVSIPLLITGTGLIKKNKEEMVKGLTIGSGIVLASGLTAGLKYTIRRTRPYETYPDLQKATDVDSPSFPSGHTSDVFATATSVSLAFPKWYVITPLYAWAGTVAYSRMHLGVHYPSDVLMGAVTGSLSAYLTYRGQKWILSRKSR